MDAIVCRKVSGLNAATARSIVEWRTTQGTFCSRQQLLSVKRLGHKAFEQCASFVKVFPKTATRQAGQGTAAPQKSWKGAKDSSSSFDPLDMTLHRPPGLTKDGIGRPHFIEKAKQETAKHGMGHFVNLLGGTLATMQLIVGTLQHSVEYGIRSEQHQPLFKSGVLSMAEVRNGLKLTGRVKNCTSFGAFVDIGVGRNGLIYPRQLKGQRVSLGNRVTVRIVSIDNVRGRIGLRLVSCARSVRRALKRAEKFLDVSLDLFLSAAL
ncbi:S1 RNA-binding domain-containing protein 1-like [Haemaphysalis longicornis]